LVTFRLFESMRAGLMDRRRSTLYPAAANGTANSCEAVSEEHCEQERNMLLSGRTFRAIRCLCPSPISTSLIPNSDEPSSMASGGKCADHPPGDDGSHPCHDGSRGRMLGIDHRRSIANQLTVVAIEQYSNLDIFGSYWQSSINWAQDETELLMAHREWQADAIII
jgi:hypothetical protein